MVCHILCFLARRVSDRHVGQWEDMMLYADNTHKVYWQHDLPHPLSAYDGRGIAKASLVPHQCSYMLTYTLAPPPPAAASGSV